jgi:hypothetical protein
MKRGLMKLLLKVMAVSAVVVSAMVAVSSNAFQRRFAQPAPPTKSEIERGRYLVEEVAKCPECHTPRKPDGELNEGVAARRIDLGPAGGSDYELGGPRAGAGGLAWLHGRAGGKSPGGWYGAERRAAAVADAHLPYVAGRCASDFGVFEVVAD